jgi:tRNA (guanine9-N1)-methyltransferase
MESEERPSKLQKQEHDSSSAETSEFADAAPNATRTEEQATIPAQPNQDPQPLSKNQQKKLRRKQAWEDGRDFRRAKRRDRAKAKRQRDREARQNAIANGEPIPLSLKKPEPGVQVPLTLVIDCSFDDLMREPEMVSLASQITRSYSDNKKSRYMAHLAISSFSGSLKNRFETALENHHLSWTGIHILSEDYVEAAKQAVGWMSEQNNSLEGPLMDLASNNYHDDAAKQDQSTTEIIYLSSDSDTTLTHLSPNTTYVIGGLVDKNRHKGICHKRASERGIKTAKLPISDYLQMASRQVLATNHVVEIMLKWLELGDWGEAFMAVIPKRKGGALKATDDGENANAEDPAHDAEGREHFQASHEEHDEETAPSGQNSVQAT